MNTLDEVHSLRGDLSSIFEKIITQSTICDRHPESGGLVVLSPNPWSWGPLAPSGQKLVGDARKLLDLWLRRAELAIGATAPDLITEFHIESEVLRTVVDRSKYSKGPVAPTITETLISIRRALDAQEAVIESLPSAQGPLENIIIPDTNALLFNPEIEKWELENPPYTIVLVPQIIRELDKHKLDRSKPLGQKAMKLVSKLKEYGRRGDTFKGVHLVGRIIYREVAIEPDMGKTLPWLRSGHGDDEILASSLELKWDNLNATVTLVTGDRNLLNKARLARVNVLDIEALRSSTSPDLDSARLTTNKTNAANSAKGKSRIRSSPVVPANTTQPVPNSKPSPSPINETKAANVPKGRSLPSITLTPINTAQSVWDSDWIRRHRDHAYMGLLAVLKTPLPGYLEIGFSLSGDKQNFLQRELLESAKSAQIHTFGWPIAIVLDQRDEYRPKPTPDGIYSEIAMEDRKSYDYWALSRNGNFYLLQNLFEDMRNSGELFFNTRIVRITETLLYCVRLYSRLGVDPSTEVNIFLVHGGLRNRRLTSAGITRPLHGSYTTIQDIVDGAISIPIKEIEPNLVKLVKDFSEPLFVLFDFFELSNPVYANIIKSFLEGRVT